MVDIAAAPTPVDDVDAPERTRRRPPLRTWWTTAAVATLAVLVVAEVGVRLVAEQLGEPLVWYSRGTQDKAEALADRDRPTDVVFAGSSAVAASIDPGRFTAADACGRTAYNAATAGAVPTVVADWLDRTVLPSTDAQVVVVGVAARDLSRSAATVTEPYFRATAVRDDLGARADRWFSSWSYVVRYRNTLRSPRALKGRYDELRGGDDEADWYDENGFRAIDDAGTDDIAQTNSPRLVIDDEQVRALDRLVVSLRDRGVTPVIAAMGSSERYASTPRAARLTDDASAAIEEIATRRDVLLVDLRSVSEPSKYVDLVHTNSIGAAEATDLLTEGLATTC